MTRDTLLEQTIQSANRWRRVRAKNAVHRYVYLVQTRRRDLRATIIIHRDAYVRCVPRKLKIHLSSAQLKEIESNKIVESYSTQQTLSRDNFRNTQFHLKDEQNRTIPSGWKYQRYIYFTFIQCHRKTISAPCNVFSIHRFPIIVISTVSTALIVPVLSSNIDVERLKSKHHEMEYNPYESNNSRVRRANNW